MAAQKFRTSQEGLRRLSPVLAGEFPAAIGLRLSRRGETRLSRRRTGQSASFPERQLIPGSGGKGARDPVPAAGAWVPMAARDGGRLCLGPERPTKRMEREVLLSPGGWGRHLRESRVFARTLQVERCTK